jgi:hypothetical protein
VNTRNTKDDRQEAHDPGPNLITNPLDKPGASDNLITNPLDKSDVHDKEGRQRRDPSGTPDNLITNPLDK